MREHVDNGARVMQPIRAQDVVLIVPDEPVAHRRRPHRRRDDSDEDREGARFHLGSRRTLSRIADAHSSMEIRTGELPSRGRQSLGCSVP